MSETVTLTTDDIQALRTATAVSFHQGDLGTFLRASFDNDVVTTKNVVAFPDRDEYRGRERTIWLSDQPSENFYAFAMITSAQYHSDWITVAKLLRKNDVLRFVWHEDYGTNDLLREHGLHADELQLHVTRGKTQLTFTVAQSTCLDNTARMIRKTRGF